MDKNKSLVRRISPETDSEIRRVQIELMKNNKKNISYLEASRLYAMTSFNGKTDLMTALRRMDKL